MKTIKIQRKETVTLLHTLYARVPDDFDIDAEAFNANVNEHLDEVDNVIDALGLDADVAFVDEDDFTTLDVIDVGPWELA